MFVFINLRNLSVTDKLETANFTSVILPPLGKTEIPDFRDVIHFHENWENKSLVKIRRVYSMLPKSNRSFIFGLSFNKMDKEIHRRSPMGTEIYFAKVHLPLDLNSRLLELQLCYSLKLRSLQ